jgi:1,4-alpha-glucan branching enzyme
MRRLQHLFLYSMILNILSVFAFAVAPSTRPGMGAIPYSGGTTFRVWAPNAETVTVAGTFNSWNSTSYPLADEGGGYWSADVTVADAYDRYKYVIDGNLWKIDPRANDVTSSVGDGIIDDNSYSWMPFTPPAWNEMIIYEMHIGSFYDPVSGSPPGTWFNAVSKLDHIQSLGVNVGEIMPIAEFAGDY